MALRLCVLLIASLVALTYAQPCNNSSRAFCVGKCAGFYCNPADALNIVECPGGDKTPCPNNRFCATVGRVPDCYKCEAAFDPVAFCAKRAPGTYCAPSYSGSMGVWSCPSGKEIHCPFGSSCKKSCKGKAICAVDNIQKHHYCPRPRTTTKSISCGAFTSSATAQSTLTTFNTSVVEDATTVTTTDVSVSQLTVTTTYTSTVPFPVISVFTEVTFTSSSTTSIEVTTTDTSVVQSIVFTGQTPQFVCTNPVTVTSVDPAFPSQYSVCLGGTLNLSCVFSVTNNASQSFCGSYVLPAA